MFAFTFNETNILLFGGLKKFPIPETVSKKDAVSKKIPEYDIERNVYLYDQTKEEWHKLKPLPANYKIANVIHNSNGKFVLFLLSSKQDLPQAITYDLRFIYPPLDRFWLHEHIKKK